MSPAGDAPLHGEVAVVTGGVRRIGRATALALAAAGAAVAIGTLGAREEGEALVEEIGAAGGRALLHLSDIATEAGAASLIAAAAAAFGGVDILVNNAAIRRHCPFLAMSLAEWHAVLGTTLDGAFLCCRAALPSMLPRGGGAIVNVGGLTAHTGVDNRAHVAAAKAGLTGLTRALAVEFGGRGVTVNCVVPGKIGGARAPSAGAASVTPGGATPLVGRSGEPTDVAAMILALCLPTGRFITGQTIHVNGGAFLG